MFWIHKKPPLKPPLWPLSQFAASPFSTNWSLTLSERERERERRCCWAIYLGRFSKTQQLRQYMSYTSGFVRLDKQTILNREPNSLIWGFMERWHANLPVYIVVPIRVKGNYKGLWSIHDSMGQQSHLEW